MDMIELRGKVNFVKDIETAVKKVRHDITEIKYEVYERDGQWVQEWIIIGFQGGAIIARNSNANSVSAIFREIGRYLDGGYYEEVEAYEAMKNNSLWKKINFKTEEDE